MFRMIAILLAILVLAAPVSAQEHYQRPEGIPPMSPLTEVVGLPPYSSVSGWCQADTSSDDCPALPLTVNTAHPAAYEAIDMWNEFTGLELFVVSPDDDHAVIQFYSNIHDSLHAYAFLYPDWDAPAEKCAVYIKLSEENPNLIAHELGHCLGLPDVFDSIEELHQHSGFLCVDESHVRYVTYVGIMSYCTYNQGISPGDICSLFFSGYPIVMPSDIRCVLPPGW